MSVHTNDKSVKKALVEYNFDENYWKEHPEQDVDVFALDITSLIVNYPKINKIISIEEIALRILDIVL